MNLLNKYSETTFFSFQNRCLTFQITIYIFIVVVIIIIIIIVVVVVVVVVVFSSDEILMNTIKCLGL